MPTITIKNGQRSLKLTKRERDQLCAAREICEDISAEFPPLTGAAGEAYDALNTVIGYREIELPSVLAKAAAK